MIQRFKSIDGLRTFLAIGIILMHIQANTSYQIDNYVWNNIIPVLTNFVYLFMIISGFSMCCGYYDKIKNGNITPNEFYKKRFAKILPFFAIVVAIEVLYSRTLISGIEGFTDLTLSFSLLPNDEISVIGVGWFLGIAFLFYMLFPYFVFLLDNKRRGWAVLVISLLLNFACIGYFFSSKFVINSFTPRHNFLYDFIYFVIGGMIYLYKDNLIKIVSNKKWIFFILCIVFTVIYIVIPNNPYIFTLKNSILFSIWLIYAIGTEGKILSNKFTEFISKISMEMYLSHMIVFRVLEKLKILNITQHDILNYIIVSILTLVGTVVFIYIINSVLKYFKEFYKKRLNPKPI